MAAERAGERAGERADVLVAGTGPDGLLLAGDLAASGLAVTVLDPAAPAGGAEPPIALHARSLELLDARGLADELIATGQVADRVAVAGIPVSLSALPSRFPFLLTAPAGRVRAVLAARAVGAGARLAGRAAIDDLRQSASGVTVQVRADGRPARLLGAAWLAANGPGGAAIRSALALATPCCRHGRVLLTGQAVHDELGSDDGLQDAVNLGWKLAACPPAGMPGPCRRPDSPRPPGPDLLASYAAERGPAAGRVLALRRRLGALGRRPAAATALLAGPAGRLVARLVSGIAVAYPHQGHWLTGRRAPDTALGPAPGPAPAAGSPSGPAPACGCGPVTRLYEALRAARPVLLARPALAVAPEVAALLPLWHGRLEVAIAEAAPASLALIRPDGYVAWATDSPSAATRYAELRRALNAWCGAPTA